MKYRMQLLRTMGFVLTPLLLASACTESGPNAAMSNVAVSFSTQSTQNPTQAPEFGGMLSSVLSDTVTDNSGNTLIVTSAEVVLREIELKRLETADCDVEPEPEGCEEFEVGPVLVDLPLSPGVRRQVAIDLDPGTYTRIDFEVHKVSGDEEDAVFVAAHPDFENLSIRVRGSFNGNDFEFTSDLDVEQEIQLIPNLVVDADNPAATNVTIQVDVNTWFRNGSGALIDPATGNKGGANESEIKENIKVSFKAFEDEDEDGEED